MARFRFFILSLIFVSAQSLQCGFAQDSTRWELPKDAKARFGKGWISGNVAYSPDGSRIAVASRIGIWLYDAATGAGVDLLAAHTHPVFAIAFSPDSSMLADAYFDTIRLWDTHSGELQQTLEAHPGGVECVAFSPDGTTFASGGRGWNATIHLWDTRSWIKVSTR